MLDRRQPPGPVGLDTLLREVDKLAAVTALGLPGLFADASEKLIDAWRARATRSYPSDLEAAPREVQLTLLAALCWRRQTEITDALVELLIGLVHKINTRAERRVDRELTADLRRVRGKEGILFRLAEAAVEHPEDTSGTRCTSGGREDAARAGPRGQGQRARLPGPGAGGAALVVLPPLPPDVDAHERYPYTFAGQQVRTVRRGLRCGDYAVTSDGTPVAAVERKSLPDLVSSLLSGRLRFALGELAALPRAAVVVEDRYSQIFRCSVRERLWVSG